MGFEDVDNTKWGMLFLQELNMLLAFRVNVIGIV